MGLLVLATSSVLTAVTASALDCPPGGSRPTGRAIAAWRELAATKILGNEAAEVQTSIRQCFPTRVPKCLEAVDEYSAEAIGLPRFRIPTPLTISSEADLPTEFLVKDANGNPVPGKVKIPDNIFEIAGGRGWLVSDYKTRGTGGFDTAPNLVIVALKNTPTQGKDILLQISPPRDAGHPENGGNPLPDPRKVHGQGTLTVITADRTQNPPVGQLRLMSGDGRSYTWNNELRSNGCVECHSVPMRSISPRGYKITNWENPMDPTDQANVDAINEIMHLRNFTWGRDQNGERLGPQEDSHPYGWAPANSPTRTEAFVTDCFDTRESQRYEGFGGYVHNTPKTPGATLRDWVPLRNAMNCASCHNGGTRGTLHSDFSFDEIVFKVLVDRSMPPEADLTPDERLALVNCIAKEKEQTFAPWQASGAWMKRESCGL